MAVPATDLWGDETDITLSVDDPGPYAAGTTTDVLVTAQDPLGNLCDASCTAEVEIIDKPDLVPSCEDYSEATCDEEIDVAVDLLWSGAGGLDLSVDNGGPYQAGETVVVDEELTQCAAARCQHHNS